MALRCRRLELPGPATSLATNGLLQGKACAGRLLHSKALLNSQMRAPDGHDCVTRRAHAKSTESKLHATQADRHQELTSTCRMHAKPPGNYGVNEAAVCCPHLGKASVRPHLIFRSNITTS